MVLTSDGFSKVTLLIYQESKAIQGKTKKEAIDYLAPKVGKFLDAEFDFKAILSAAGITAAAIGIAAETVDEMVFTEMAKVLLEKVVMVSWPDQL